MARGLSWVFTLIDKFSGPGKGIVGTIRQIDTAMRQANSVATSLESKLGKPILKAQKQVEKLKKTASKGGGDGTFDLGAIVGKHLKVLERQETLQRRSLERRRRRQVRFLRNDINRALRNAKKHGRIADRLHKQYLRAVTRANKTSSGMWRRFSKNAFFAMSNIMMAYHGVVSAMQGPIEVGRLAVDAAGFKETSMVALEAFLGRGQEAKEVYEKIVQFAEKLRVPTKQVEQTFVRLLSAGFRLSEVPIAFQGLSDLMSLASQSPLEVLSRMTLALSQIKAKTRLEAQDLRQIIEQAAQSGVGQADIYEAVARKVGISQKKLMQRLEGGATVESSLAIYAIFDAIRERLGGESEKLGEITDRLGDSLPRLISFIKSRPFDLFRDVGKTEGIQDFKSALHSVIDLTSALTDEGAKTKKAMEGLVSDGFSAVFKPFAGPEGKKLIVGMFEALVFVVKKLGGIFKPIGGLMVNVFDALSPLLAGVLEILHGLAPMIAGVGEGFVIVWKPILWVVGMVATLLGKVLQISTGFGETVPLFKAFGVVLGLIAATLSIIAIKSAIVAASVLLATWPFVLAVLAISALIAAIDYLIGKYKELGEAGITGLISGWLSGEEEVRGAGVQVGQQLVDGVKSKQALDMNSPPKAMVDIGTASREALGDSFEGGADPAFNIKRSNIIGGDSVTGSGTGGNSIVIPIHADIIVGPSPDDDNEDLAERVLAKFGDRFETMLRTHLVAAVGG